MLMILKHTLSTLAVLLLVGAQVFGLQRGYECHHHEVAEVTMAGHCHRAEAGFVPCASAPAGETGDHDDHEGATDPHAPLMLSIAAELSAQTSVSIPHFTAILLAELPVFDRVWVNECVLSQVNNLPPDAGGERPPPAALQVARCMVLLV